MVSPIGRIASRAQGVGYFEKDRDCEIYVGRTARRAPRRPRGGAAPGLSGPVDPERFRSAPLMAMMDGAERIVEAHEKAVAA